MMTYIPGKQAVAAVWQPMFIFVIGIVAIWFVYSLALPGFILFDDTPNLQGLAQVTDWRSQLYFIFSGVAGPLGRPLSLVTFVAQHADWPDHPEAMLRVNIAIHLLSVITVFILALGMARIRPDYPVNRSLWMATALALLWGLSPFLATTHLIIIQRMTSLAALQIFGGLACFVWAHLIFKSHPALAKILLVLGLGFGTLLATLAKENGALLPLLAITILWLWIPNNQRMRGRTAKFIIIALAVVPTLLLIGYLLFHSIQVFENGYGAHRQFTPYQRILTQLWLLFDYFLNLLIPRAINVSPFTDDILPATGLLSSPITLISLLAWISLISISNHLRERAPYLLFGIIFFLAAHLIESTTIGLELYFAHRNYLAAFGLYFAIVFGVARLPAQYVRIGIFALCGYICLFLLILIQVTANWNQNGITSEIWLTRHPDSLRAAQFHANHYLKFGDPVTALQILDSAAVRNPANAMVKIQRTLICAGREDRFLENLTELKSQLGTLPLTPAAASDLAGIAMSDLSRYCPKLKYEDIVDIADLLLANPSYAQSPFAKGQLLIAKGYAEAEQDNMSKAINFFVEAFRIDPQLDTAFTASSLMSNAGEYARAAEFLSEARQQAPSSYIRRLIWLQRVDAFDQILEQSRLIAEARKIN